MDTQAIKEFEGHSTEVFPRHFDTFEEFIAWVDEDMSAEWQDGEVIFMSPVSMRHQLIKNLLLHVLDLFVQKNQLGLIFDAPFKMKLENYGPEPDILFVTAENQSRIRQNHLEGPADLVIEIISPESDQRDRGHKFLAYEAAGIPEYWLIDPLREEAQFFRLQENGRYQNTPLDKNGRYHSRILSGLWLDPNWFWQTPLPSVFTILRQLQII